MDNDVWKSIVYVWQTKACWLIWASMSQVIIGSGNSVEPLSHEVIFWASDECINIQWIQWKKWLKIHWSIS